MKLHDIHILLIFLACLSSAGQGIANGARRYAPSDETLPFPTGVHPVGTRFTVLTDASRQIKLNGKPSEPRIILVQWWFPTEATGPKARYVADGHLLDAMEEANYYYQEKTVFDHWRRLQTHAIAGADPKPGKRPWPLIVFSTGLGVSRMNYSILAQEMASWGNVVAVVEHPYGSFGRTPEGKLLTTDEDREIMNDKELVAKRVSEWVGDTGFLIDQLSLPSSNLAVFAGFVDLEKIAYMGHSMGGNAALQAGLDDPRIKVAVNMDGAPFGKINERGLGCPSLLLRSLPDYSDEDLAKRGRTRERWRQMGEEIVAMWQKVFSAGEKVPFYVASIKGTGHMNYSDAPFVMPDTITRFGGKVIQPQRFMEIVITVIQWFLEEHLHHRGETPFARLGEAFPELRFEQW